MAPEAGVLRTVIIDAQQIVREGFKRVIAGAGDIAVVGESGAAQPALGVIDEQRPDLVVLELALPGLDGCGVAREIVRRRPEAHLLALTARRSAHDVLDALAAGFLGYALKCQPAEEVLMAVRQVGRGEPYLEPQLAHLGKRPGTSQTIDGLLSPREREVFRLLARGCSNAAAARALCISPKTLETHRGRLYRKLAIRNIADLVRLACLEGLLH
jgi:DNA-binding NarL/FixJ family response regulator